MSDLRINKIETIAIVYSLGEDQLLALVEVGLRALRKEYTDPQLVDNLTPDEFQDLMSLLAEFMDDQQTTGAVVTKQYTTWVDCPICEHQNKYYDFCQDGDEVECESCLVTIRINGVTEKQVY